MNEPMQPLWNGDAEPVEASPRRGWPIGAWVVIAAIVTIAVLGLRRPEPEDLAPNQADPVGKVLLEIQARYLVGVTELLGQGGEEVLAQMKPFGHGPVDHHLCTAIFAGDLAGPAAALQQLERLDRDLAKWKVMPSPEQKRLRELLGLLYRDYAHLRFDGPSVSPKDRVFLRDHLQWFGELALAPKGIVVDAQALAGSVGGGPAAAVADANAKIESSNRKLVAQPAIRTFAAFAGTLLILFLVAIGGFVALILLIAFARRGTLQTGLQCGTGNGGIYAETFAVWLVVWLGLSAAVSFLNGWQSDLLLAGTASLLSLVALAWPVFRGIPWTQVRQDIGLIRDNNPNLEPVYGLLTYAMALPILAVGFSLMLVLVTIRASLTEPSANPFMPSAFPSHPLVEFVGEGNGERIFVAFFLACVVAPVVEETMFRGVLYRHLRELSCAWRRWLSVLFSATLVSFVFAVIHPQGIVAVPAIMALAYGFTIAREWRESLIPCMVAHSISNGVITLVLVLAVSQ